jgi:hypothetical protein
MEIAKTRDSRFPSAGLRLWSVSGLLAEKVDGGNGPKPAPIETCPE